MPHPYSQSRPYTRPYTPLSNNQNMSQINKVITPRSYANDTNFINSHSNPYSNNLHNNILLSQQNNELKKQLSEQLKKRQYLQQQTKRLQQQNNRLKYSRNSNNLSSNNQTNTLKMQNQRLKQQIQRKKQQIQQNNENNNIPRYMIDQLNQLRQENVGLRKNANQLMMKGNNSANINDNKGNYNANGYGKNNYY